MHDQLTLEDGLCECGCGQRTNLAPKTSARHGWKQGEPLRFVFGHHMRARPEHEVRDCGYETPCWVWVLALDPKGYGIRYHETRMQRAHRVVYERHRGLIPDGLELDHLCRITSCVNPDHLEPVTHAENVRRGRVARLSHEQVKQIKSLIAQGWRLVDIAHAYELSSGYVGDIKRGRAWADVEP